MHEPPEIEQPDRRPSSSSSGLGVDVFNIPRPSTNHSGIGSNDPFSLTMTKTFYAHANSNIMQEEDEVNINDDQPIEFGGQSFQAGIKIKINKCEKP